MKVLDAINWAQLYNKKNYCLISFRNDRNAKLIFNCVKEIFLKFYVFYVDNIAYIVITESKILERGIGEGTIGFDYEIFINNEEYSGEINYTFDRDLFPLLTQQ